MWQPFCSQACCYCLAHFSYLWGNYIQLRVCNGTNDSPGSNNFVLLQYGSPMHRVLAVQVGMFVGTKWFYDSNIEKLYSSLKIPSLMAQFVNNWYCLFMAWITVAWLKKKKRQLKTLNQKDYGICISSCLDIILDRLFWVNRLVCACRLDDFQRALEIKFLWRVESPGQGRNFQELSCPSWIEGGGRVGQGDVSAAACLGAEEDMWEVACAGMMVSLAAGLCCFKCLHRALPMAEKSNFSCTSPSLPWQGLILYKFPCIV